ncbi:MAG: thiamine pyrophosphate-binding protein [Salinigranum sp.]
MSQTGAQILVETLERAGVDRVFGLVGSTVLEILDEVEQHDGIDYVSTRHEQVAASMAAGYALAARKPSVSISHVGPGAANQIIGVAAAFRDDVPVISITGNEESHTLGKDVNHEWDVTGVFERFTKHSVQVTHDDPFGRIRNAVLQAQTGMPGAVHLDVPEDVAESPHDAPSPRAYDRIEAATGRVSRTPSRPPAEAVRRSVELLSEAERPLVVAGAELRWFDAEDALRAFAETLDVPVATAQNARGALSENHPLSLGYVANSGIDPTNEYFASADYVLAVGTRLSDKTTKGWTMIDEEATLVQATIDAANLDRYYTADVGMLADPRSTLEALTREAASLDRSFESVAAEARAAYVEERERLLEPAPHDGDGVDPRRVVTAVRERATDLAYATGGGVHNTYPRLLPVDDMNGRFVTANFTGMSQGLPLAMGAKVALPDRDVVAFEGDGGFAMVMQDMETLVRESIPVKIILLNNDAYMSHAVRQRDRYDRFVGTHHGNPAYDAVAEEFGLVGLRATADDEVEDAVADLFEADGPALLDVHVDPELGA